MKTAIVRALTRFTARVRPGHRKTERDARKVLGMPARHPEQLTRELSEGQEEWLAGLAADLWPADEYTQIVTETRREEQ